MISKEKNRVLQERTNGIVEKIEDIRIVLETHLFKNTKKINATAISLSNDKGIDEIYFPRPLSEQEKDILLKNRVEYSMQSTFSRPNDFSFQQKWEYVLRLLDGPYLNLIMERKISLNGRRI